MSITVHWKTMNHECFLTVAERLTEPVLLLCVDGRVLQCNSAARHALGGALIGEDLCARAGSTAKFRRYLRLAARSSSPLPGAVIFDGAHPKWRCDTSAVATPTERVLIMQLRSVSETVRRFMALNEQIDRLHAEIRRREALERERTALLESEREARAAAEETSRFKDELLAAVSHELRTPLHAIQGWLSLIRKNPDDKARVARGLDVIERNVAAEAKLTEDLIDASLAITGRMKLDLSEVDLELIVREAVDSILPAAEAKRQRIEVICNVGNCRVVGDAGRLQQVIWNLLSNATRYTPKGGRIQIVLRRLNSHAEISISDTGEGIAPEVLPYIFDRFRRADGSSTRRRGGLGLGLSIVRHLVELHGGFVIVESEGLGHGTTFTINLPLPVFEGHPVMHSVPVTELPGATRGALIGVDILLVEDHEDSRELLAAILEGEGAAVTAAEDAHRALEEFRQQPPHVVISDIEMPSEDGFTMMRKLRDLERELGRTPVSAIAVSAHSIGDARLHALRAGYQTFVAKPIQPDELVAMVANLCHHRRRDDAP